MSLESQSAHFHAFEWLRVEALKGNKHAMALITRIRNVEKQLIVPGAWYCQKCGFECFHNLMSANTGNVCTDSTIRDEACPNDGELMLQQTWKFRCESIAVACETQVKRAMTAEDLLQSMYHLLKGAIPSMEAAPHIFQAQTWDNTKRHVMESYEKAYPQKPENLNAISPDRTKTT